MNTVEVENAQTAVELYSTKYCKHSTDITIETCNTEVSFPNHDMNQKSVILSVEVDGVFIGIVYTCTQTIT